MIQCCQADVNRAPRVEAPSTTTLQRRNYVLRAHQMLQILELTNYDLQQKFCVDCLSGALAGWVVNNLVAVTAVTHLYWSGISMRARRAKSASALGS